jgi:ubiquitin-protein ligase
MDRRESRLKKEFDRICTLTGPFSLIDFRCAMLSMGEATEVLKAKKDLEAFDWNNFLTSDEFRQRCPNDVPEKYMVQYRCTGLARAEQGQIVKTERHQMAVIYGYDYPEQPPTLIWGTPIWHPNIQLPYICAHGRAFAVSVSLDQIVLTIGEMVQYRNFNLRDPLNHEAAAWAREHLHEFPIDERDLTDATRHAHGRAAAPTADANVLVEWVDAVPGGEVTGGPMVELLS